jgi:transposase InsO family protein
MMTSLSKGQKILLEKAYLNPAHPASFTSAEKLRANLILKKQSTKRGKKVRVPSISEIQQWLLHRRPYTVHKPARKRYKMKKVVVPGVNIQLQADLVDMQQWARSNDGFRYILLALDTFSRYAYCRPLKTKQGHVVVVSLEAILDEAENRIDRKIKKLQTDQGLEFYNKHVKEMLERRHVFLFSTKSPTKAQMVERLIRTLRSRQERFNTYRGSRRWLENFPVLVKSYNKTVHSALPKGMTPSDVNLKNERDIWMHLYGNEFFKKPKRVRRKELKIGNLVRLSKRKQLFEKSFYQNFTDEIFSVAHVSRRTNPPTYRIKDLNDQLLEGIFYFEELALVEDDGVYAIEEILKEEIRKDGKKYILVKWRGYPSSENAWIRADSVASIKKAS